MGKFFTPGTVFVLVLALVTIICAYALVNKYLDQRTPAACENKK